MRPNTLTAWLLQGFLLLGACNDVYDCSQPCGGAEFNFELTARVCPGTQFKVSPGSTMSVLLRNELFGEILPKAPAAEDYLMFLNRSDSRNPYRYLPDCKVDHHNIPQNYNNVNLHFHGLDIGDEMFYEDQLISVPPGGCFCYNLTVHSHPGLFWYHPHVHGSVAVQMWSGMLGLFVVTGGLDRLNTSFALDYQTTQERIPTEYFVLWDSRMLHNRTAEPITEVQAGLAPPRWTINAQEQPTFVVEGEILLRLLAAPVDSMASFLIDPPHPLTLLASDGVTYPQPVRHDGLLILSGGQREDILLTFDRPGNYTITLSGLSTHQFFGVGPRESVLAYIRVVSGIPQSRLLWPTGAPHLCCQPPNIPDSAISSVVQLTFSVGVDTRSIPFPQYKFNNLRYDPTRIDYTGELGTCALWVVTNTEPASHPFHIHINRFQVMSMTTGANQSDPIFLALAKERYPKIWRDTVLVPPLGIVRLRTCYDPQWRGRALIHCHFAIHEDTGMMGQISLARNLSSFPAATSAPAQSTSTPPPSSPSPPFTGCQIRLGSCCSQVGADGCCAEYSDCQCLQKRTLGKEEFTADEGVNSGVSLFWILFAASAVGALVVGNFAFYWFWNGWHSN